MMALLRRIPQDKLLHILAGLVVAVATWLLCAGLGLLGHVVLTALFSVAAGLLKELYDYGDFDPLDLLATVAGGALGLFVLLVGRLA